MSNSENLLGLNYHKFYDFQLILPNLGVILLSTLFFLKWSTWDLVYDLLTSLEGRSKPSIKNLFQPITHFSFPEDAPIILVSEIQNKMLYRIWRENFQRRDEKSHFFRTRQFRFRFDTSEDSLRDLESTFVVCRLKIVKLSKWDYLSSYSFFWCRKITSRYLTDFRRRQNWLQFWRISSDAVIESSCTLQKGAPKIIFCHVYENRPPFLYELVTGVGKGVLSYLPLRPRHFPSPWSVQVRRNSNLGEYLEKTFKNFKKIWQYFGGSYEKYWKSEENKEEIGNKLNFFFLNCEILKKLLEDIYQDVKKI